MTLDDMVPYVGLPETGDLGVKEILRRPYKEVKGRNIINQGDILFARIEPSIFNKKYIFVDNLHGNNYAFTSTEFYVIKADERINPKFLFYMFFTENVYSQVIGKTTGSTGRRRLDKGVFEKLLIPNPKREIQDKIVEIMQNAYRIKKQNEDEAKKQLESINYYVLDELGILMPELDNKMCYAIKSDLIETRLDPYYNSLKFQTLESLISNKPYVEFVTVGDIAEVVTKGETPLWRGDSYLNEGTPFLKAQNISPQGIKGEITYISKEVHNRMKRSQLKGGELLYTMAGTIGIATIFPDDFREANINQAVCKIVLKDGVDKEYVCILLNSAYCKMQAMRFLTTSAQPNINFDQIKAIKVPIPSFESQQKIVAEVKIRMQIAEQLQKEAQQILEKAKLEVEDILRSYAVELRNKKL